MTLHDFDGGEGMNYQVFVQTPDHAYSMVCIMGAATLEASYSGTPLL